MTLLAPAATLFAAAITLPFLVLLYLLKLRRRPVRVSTSMFWQRAEQDLQANVPLRWLRPTVLFLLHLFILAALVLALGRPALKHGGIARERVVLLLDCSASMSATDMPQGQSRLAAAKKRAANIVEDLARAGSSACVVSFAHDTKVLAPMTSSRRTLFSAIESAEPTDQPADLAAALAIVESIARPSGEESGASSSPASVILLSDGGVPPSTDFRARGVHVRLEHVGPTPPSPEIEHAPHKNVGIVVLAARRDPDDPGTVRLFARLVNADDKEAPLPVTLSLDGQVLERRAITAPAKSSAALGEASLSFEFVSPRGGLVLLSLGREDALAADNQASLVLPPPAQPAILLAHRELNAADPRREAHDTALALLRDALVELRPRTLRVVDEQQLASVFASGEWRAFDLFIALDAVPPTPLPIASITFGALPNLNGLALDAPTPPIGNHPPTESQSILQWERSHPLLRGVPLDSLQFTHANAVRFTPSATFSTVPITLARGIDGPIIALLQDANIRHVVVAFALEDSNWPLQVGFPLFLANAVDYLTLRGESSLGHAFTTSEPIFFPANALPAQHTLTLDGPVKVDIDTSNTLDGQLSVGVLPHAGVYIPTAARELPPLAVNLFDATESSLAERTSLDIASADPVASAIESPREVWPWFVLAAALALILEWIVYAWQMRV